MIDAPIMLTGCSGGGKSTLLTALGARGYPVFEEVGRTLVREQLASGGNALPWTDLVAFVEAAAARSARDYDAACRLGTRCFVDRGVIDVVVALESRGLAVSTELAEVVRRCRYAQPVFTVPPWPEIYRQDEERRHGFDQAVAAHAKTDAAYRRHGYDLVEVPRLPVEERADFILARLDQSSSA